MRGGGTLGLLPLRVGAGAPWDARGVPSAVRLEGSTQVSSGRCSMGEQAASAGRTGACAGSHWRAGSLSRQDRGELGGRGQGCCQCGWGWGVVLVNNVTVGGCSVSIIIVFWEFTVST